MSESNYERNIAGQTFGRLKATTPVEEGKLTGLWKCECECGETCEVSYWNLVRNHTKSCGCLKSPDLTGKTFGKLKVLGRSDKRAPRGKRTVPLWECECECGEITYKAADTLSNNDYHSCARCAELYAATAAKEGAGFVEGTQISKIRSTKPPVTNTSGVRGVYYEKKSGKWRARLRFQGKTYSFGSYEKFEDAVQARKEAEEKVFGKFLEQHGEKINREPFEGATKTGEMPKKSSLDAKIGVVKINKRPAKQDNKEKFR